jgi:hypothetical protein
VRRGEDAARGLEAVPLANALDELLAPPVPTARPAAHGAVAVAVVAVRERVPDFCHWEDGSGLGGDVRWLRLVLGLAAG